MNAPRLEHWPPDLSRIGPGWREPIDRFLASPTGQALSQHMAQRLAAGATIYPPRPWHALELTAPEQVRVVILGQDPYHGPGQAYGLAFAVPPGTRPPPSLRNIAAELEREYGQPPRLEGLLPYWARQGVLLLNTSLTVEAGQAASHARIGWQQLTHALFAQLAQGPRPLVFMLWGTHAQAMQPPTPGPHLWLQANHPSPLSARRAPRPFIGCGHFAQANAFLQAQGRPPIDWLGLHADP